MLVQNFLERSAEAHPDKIALVCGSTRLTYSQIDEMSSALSASLVELGLKRHDRVAIFLDNSPEAAISIFAIAKCGATFVVLNPAMKSKKLGYILRDSGAAFIVTHGSKARVLIDILSDTPDLKCVIWAKKVPQAVDTASTVPCHVSWSEIVEAGAHEALLQRVKTIDVDLAAIIYTSGSTGKPKGVMSTHQNIYSAASSIIEYLENRESDVILNCLPLAFDYGLYQLLMTFLFGGTLVLERSFVYPAKVVQLLEKESVTGFPIVPTMAAMLLQMESLKALDFSALRYITNTAAALPVAHIKGLQELFPHVKIYSMYGLTECKRVSYLPPEELKRRPESVGIPIPNEEVYILNRNGEEVRPGEVGELVVRGANVMQGYWNAPEETAKVFRRGRYPGEVLLFTGDLFTRDEDGYLYFIARKDDLIKTKGERVSPREIEEVLSELQGVAEVAVIGVEDELLGQAIKAYIVPAAGAELSESSVKRHCMDNLEPFMVPKYVVFCPELPKTAAGKVDKRSLKAQHAAGNHQPVQREGNRLEYC